MIGFQWAALLVATATFLYVGRKFLGASVASIIAIMLLLSGGSAIYIMDCPSCLNFIGMVKGGVETGIEVGQTVPAVTGRVIDNIIERQQDQGLRTTRQPIQQAPSQLQSEQTARAAPTDAGFQRNPYPSVSTDLDRINPGDV